MTVRVELIVQAARAQAGDRYVFGAEAAWSDPDPSAFDCSELIEWVCHRHGIADCPDGSKAQLDWCRRKGTLLELPQGIARRGALLFRMTGNPTHVAMTLGDGRTIEARGVRYGVNEFPSSGRAWTHAALIPGVDYSAPAMPNLRKAGMILNIDGSPYFFFVRGCDDAGRLVLVSLSEAEAWSLAAAGLQVIKVGRELFDKLRMGDRWFGSEAA